jgi:hypothetical protein
MAAYAQKHCQNVGADIFPIPTFLAELLGKKKHKQALFNSGLVVVNQFAGSCSCWQGQ